MGQLAWSAVQPLISAKLEGLTHETAKAPRHCCETPKSAGIYKSENGDSANELVIMTITFVRTHKHKHTHTRMCTAVRPFLIMTCIYRRGPPVLQDLED